MGKTPESLSKLRRVLIMEIVGVSHIIHHITCGDMLRLIVNQHQKNNVTGILTYRDLKQIFAKDNVYMTPSIEVRRGCILVCFPPVTSIILYNKVYLLLNDELNTDTLITKLKFIGQIKKSGGSVIERVSSLQSEESECLREEEWENEVYPYEFSVLEILINSALEYISKDIDKIECDLSNLRLKCQAKAPSTLDLEEIQYLREPIETLKDKVTNIDRVFDSLLTDAEDLKRMELSYYHTRPSMYDIMRHNEPPNATLEFLLEFFDQEASVLVGRVRYLSQGIENVEKLISLRLAIQRNKLIQLDLAATLLGVGVAFGACIAGVFGMNVRNGVENIAGVFYILIAVVLMFAASSGFIALVVLKRSPL